MRSRRGYTIMEVGLVTALSTLLLVGALRWIIGLGGVVNASLDEAETATLNRAAYQFVLDVAAAEPCLPAGTDAPVRLVSPSLVRLYTSSGGSLKAVTWTISGGSLMRSEEVPASDCVFGEPVSWVTWARDLDVADSGFVGVRGGALVELGTDGACATTWVAKCRLDGVDVVFKSSEDALAAHYVALLPS